MSMSPVAGDESLTGLTREEADSVDWVGMAAGGSLVAGGVLYLLGQRRAGLATAITGAALAVLDQQDLLRRFWKEMPGYVDQVQDLLGDLQNLVDEVSNRRAKLIQVVKKASSAAAPES